MKIIIPFEEKVSFDSLINDITSISLEHEITKNEDTILGNFLVTGTYKEYELSMNEKDFNFVVPFEINLTKKIETNSLEVLIDNFTYELEGKDLTLKIDLDVSADERSEITFEKVEEINESPVELIEEVKENRNDFIEDERPLLEDNISQENVINSIPDLEEDYFTYHVHLVKEKETIENISAFYNTTKDNIFLLNGIESVKVGDKILVPFKNE